MTISNSDSLSKTKMITETYHPYYCSGSNYYSNDADGNFETVTDFLDSFESMDIDLNLCFRFDIKESGDGTLYAEFFLMLQRKGIFKPVYCSSYNPETESDRLESYLKRHFDVLMSIWTPISLPATEEV